MSTRRSSAASRDLCASARLARREDGSGKVAVMKRIALLWLGFALAAVRLSALGVAANPTAAPESTDPPATTGRVTPHDFGVGNVQVYEVSAMSVPPMISDTVYNYEGSVRYKLSGSPWFVGSVAIPTGALLTGIEIDACDTNPAAFVSVAINRCVNHNGGCTELGLAASGTTETPGCQFFYSATTAETIDHGAYTYHFVVADTGTNHFTTFQSVRVYWQRQMSPAPAAATFGDVSTSHPFFRAIEAFAGSGITTGCGGGNFCPTGS